MVAEIRIEESETVVYERDEFSLDDIELTPEQAKILTNLHYGLMKKGDPATWRTTIVDLGKGIGGFHPEKEDVPAYLTDRARIIAQRVLTGTPIKSLMQEALDSLGIETEHDNTPLHALLLNGRHSPEPLLWSIAEELKKESPLVAVLNPTGHYNDRDTRIVTPRLNRDINSLIITASTQELYGGNLSVLTKALYPLAFSDWAEHVKNVFIIIPCYGGQRGDRPTQSHRKGNEVPEAAASARILSVVLNDILLQMRDEFGIQDLPQVRVIAGDIHSKVEPISTFNRYGIEFVSAEPEQEFARSFVREQKRVGLQHLPFSLLSCDRGCIQRTERLGISILLDPDYLPDYVDITYMDKARPMDGKVSSLTPYQSYRWWRLPDNTFYSEELPIPTKDTPHKDKCIMAAKDDIGDTVTTAGMNMELGFELHSDVEYSMFGVTHPIHSQGISNLSKLSKVNAVFLGDTLQIPEVPVEIHPNTQTVNTAAAFVRAMK